MRFTSSTSADGVIERLFTLGDIPGVLWTPGHAAGTRPLIVLGHGGGQHKQAPGVVATARHFVTAAGFAAVAVDAPHHGDRPTTAEFTRITTELRAAMQNGGDPLPSVAAMHAHLAGQSVPEWQAVVTAVQELGEVGTGPVGYWGMSMGCGLGLPFIAADPRVRAAVLGLAGATVPTGNAVPTGATVPTGNAESTGQARHAGDPRCAGDGGRAGDSGKSGQAGSSGDAGLAGHAARVTVPVRFLAQWDDRLVPREQALALFDALASPVKTLHVNPGGHGDTPRCEMDSARRFLAHHLG